MCSDPNTSIAQVKVFEKHGTWVVSNCDKRLASVSLVMQLWKPKSSTSNHVKICIVPKKMPLKKKNHLQLITPVRLRAGTNFKKKCKGCVLFVTWSFRHLKFYSLWKEFFEVKVQIFHDEDFTDVEVKVLYDKTTQKVQLLQKIFQVHVLPASDNNTKSVCTVFVKHW